MVKFSRSAERIPDLLARFAGLISIDIVPLPLGKRRMI